MNIIKKANNYAIDACSIRLIYPISFDKSVSDIETIIENLTISESIDGQLPKVYQCLTGLDDTQVVWQPYDVKVSNDFHPHIVKMISDKYSSVRNDHKLVKSYQISEVASKILNNKSSGGLKLQLSSAAIKRLQTENSSNEFNDEPLVTSVPFNIGYLNRKSKQGVYLHLYDLKIAIIECHVCPYSDFLKDTGFSGVQEFVYDMTHINRLVKGKKSLRVRYSDNDDQYGFNMIDIVRICLGLPIISDEDNNDIESQVFVPFSNSRFFSYTALQLGERTQETDALNSDDLVRLSHYLAKRHTSHYKDLNEDLTKNSYLPFSNISYSMSIEGGAVIVNACKQDNNGESIEHLNSFIKNSLKNVYWPMTLLAYIESLYLLKLNNTSLPHTDLQSVSNISLTKLECFRSDILNFRLNYRFLQISSLENHNIYYEKWRQVFSNEKMMHELSDDVTQLNEFLSYRLEKEEQKLEKKRVEETKVIEGENRKIEAKRELVLSRLAILATGLLSLLGLYGTNFSEFSDFAILSWTTFLGLVFIIFCTYVALELYNRARKEKLIITHLWNKLKGFL